MFKRIVLTFLLALIFTLIGPTLQIPAQALQEGVALPRIELIEVPPLELPGQVDSNSPSFWQYVSGQNRLHILTSWGNPSISQGLSVRRLGPPQPVRYLQQSNGPR